MEDERVRSMGDDGGRTAKFAIVVKVHFNSPGKENKIEHVKRFSCVSSRYSTRSRRIQYYMHGCGTTDHLQTGHNFLTGLSY